MASKAAQKRLSKEFVVMQREPPPFVWASPDEKNILTWNFLIRGPPDSPYDGGEYHGVLLFPAEYPFKPPGIKMFTPSGRFHPDRKICFSMSDFHPGSWNPAWSVATILTGLLSFMLSDEMTTGSVTSTDAHKRAFAARSHAFNLTQQRFRDAFPEYCTSTLHNPPNMGEKERGKSDVKTSPIHIPPSFRPSTASSTLRAATLESRDAASASHSEAITRTSGAAQVPVGWMTTWRHFITEKWRLCAFIALAVMVSRFSSRA
ncbi:UBC-like protein [Crepidotus variabilis]|uniref:Ubiquitin-conjugating enzyme E2 6 n=1 Tax=Crepidotus variabilis TaxID=179855 RepID=A0A9P6EHB7_9AGAR|nr:UBC-like protein [Crepidotus variabilis]